MFAHRLLLTKKLSLVSKKPLKIFKQLNASQEFSTSGSNLSSFKDDEREQMNVSLFNIKKSLKLANIEFDDGFTHLKTICPACDPAGKAEDIYINKTTGEIEISTSEKHFLMIYFFRTIRLPEMPLRSQVRTNREILHNLPIAKDNQRAYHLPKTLPHL